MMNAQFLPAAQAEGRPDQSVLAGAAAAATTTTTTATATLLEFRAKDGDSPDESRDAFEAKLRAAGIHGRRVGHVGAPGFQTVQGTVNWYACSDKRLRIDGSGGQELHAQLQKIFPPYDKSKGRAYWAAARKGKKQKPDIPKQVRDYLDEDEP